MALLALSSCRNVCRVLRGAAPPGEVRASVHLPLICEAENRTLCGAVFPTSRHRFVRVGECALERRESRLSRKGGPANKKNELP